MTAEPGLPALRSRNGGAGSPLNFHQLYIFHAVATHRSFSRASVALNITQPAVSLQVQELEKFIGAPLLHRRARGLQLTEMGETAFAYAQQIFALSGKLLETMDEIHNLQSGYLTLAASATPGEYLLPAALGKFRRLYPGIQVRMSIGNTQSVLQRLLNQELDLGMVGGHPPPPHPELGLLDYVEDEIVLVAAPGHPLAGQRQITAAQAVAAGLILREPGSATRSAAERQLSRLGLATAAALSLGSNQAIKQAAAAGGGVGVLSRLGLAAEVKAGLLTVLPVADWRCVRPLTLIYPKERRLSPTQQAFLEFLQRERAALAGDGFKQG